ncbi:hypothetical protein NQ317_003776, partial [Molorchus minor]
MNSNYYRYRNREASHSDCRMLLLILLCSLAPAVLSSAYVQSVSPCSTPYTFLECIGVKPEADLLRSRRQEGYFYNPPIIPFEEGTTRRPPPPIITTTTQRTVTFTNPPGAYYK